MKWKMATAKTIKINRAASTPRHGLDHYCRDEWLAAFVDGPGERPATRRAVVGRPFLEYLASSDLSPKTIQRHVDNIWALGGEFIRHLHNDPSLRRRPVGQALSRMIEFGAPLLYDGGENQQKSFDSTCRKLRRFLIETAG